MKVETFSRIQFAFTVSFHYIYPPLSIGLGVMLVFREDMYIKTGKKIYEK
jgi:cytochrome bd ubiquinol oxidase subunit I